MEKNSFISNLRKVSIQKVRKKKIKSISYTLKEMDFIYLNFLSVRNSRFVEGTLSLSS